MLPSVIVGPGVVGTSYGIQRGSRLCSALPTKRYQRNTFGCVPTGVVPGGEAGGGGNAGGGGDEAGGNAEVVAVFVARFAFVRAAGGFMTAGANGSSSAVMGSGVMTVVGAMPASPDCMELDSLTEIRTGTLCG
jgi:hypothetical protein